MRFVVETVDGSEILRSPVEVGSLSHYLYTRFIHPNGGCLGFLPSTVLITKKNDKVEKPQQCLDGMFLGSSHTKPQFRCDWMSTCNSGSMVMGDFTPVYISHF